MPETIKNLLITVVIGLIWIIVGSLLGISFNKADLFILGVVSYVLVLTHKDG